MYGYNAEPPIAIPIYTVLPYCVIIPGGYLWTLEASPIWNMNAQLASCQVYAHPMWPGQLCVRMSINDIPDRDGHVRTA